MKKFVLKCLSYSFIPIGLVCGVLLSRACDKKFPDKTLEQRKSDYAEGCKKEGAKYWSFQMGCIYEIK